MDTVITIPNERLLATIGRSTSLNDAFTNADDVLRQAIQGISDLILVPGMINLDFADVRTIMSGMGFAIMGTGLAEGDNRAMNAANAAISSPLLEDASVKGARGVIINVTGGPTLAHRSERSLRDHPGGGPRRGEHHLRRRRGSADGRQGEDHRDRDRLRRPTWRTRSRPRLRRHLSICSPSAWKQESGERVAMATLQLAEGRRFQPRGIDIPLPVEYDDVDAGPGAEFQPASPLDVPAFLRRQSEG